jgi:hypothetical protein
LTLLLEPFGDVKLEGCFEAEALGNPQKHSQHRDDGQKGVECKGGRLGVAIILNKVPARIDKDVMDPG